ncbi:MAG: DUF2846 domain-containing protein [Nitrospirota bacterium]
MIKKGFILLSMLLLSFCIPMLQSCGPTLGPAFQKTDKIPEEMGMVYIYRPSKGFGAAITPDVYANGFVITTLYNGGYYPYLTKPGEIEFSAKTESTSAVTLDIKPGQIYYLKGYIGIGFFVGRPHLTVVSPEVGEKEIAECKLIPEKKAE